MVKDIVEVVKYKSGCYVFTRFKRHRKGCEQLKSKVK